jgi:predicted RNA-binding Zn-ribbon protein involved in translation (DUF1610 family)
MGVVDPRGAGEAWAKVVFGAQTRGRGRRDLDEAARAEMAPQGPEAGFACPRCGGTLRVLPGGRLATRVPTEMLGCAACGFVGLREAP